MSIRIGNSCINCENLGKNNLCSKHGVKVAKNYTCDSFNMKAALKNDPNCGNCARFESSNCANPTKAAPSMLCSHWAPQNAQA
ncbi:hypothetical protein BTO05_13615 [Winogradskyella sp. PC-19]|uniref:hypothetical protein n=1 Tax=unclassified Winogradskyella TaxID=2615021 RepID=UPI000B3D159E|nr:MULTISPECIES: hypothetical protein [unclassified Winogradskyella]ARV10621.1 hypothetical protein BTO05_13615 [Winogradskyella sp. PC-19]